MLVLEIYRITLLSNSNEEVRDTIRSFGDLQNYTTLKHNSRHVRHESYFGDLQNYTTLKLSSSSTPSNESFGDLQNYTTLKREMC